MFGLFKKQPTGTTITLKLSGLHCSSCSLNIDGELADLPGVISAKTSYARQVSVISYDPKITTPEQVTKTITSLGYQVF